MRVLQITWLVGGSALSLVGLAAASSQGPCRLLRAEANVPGRIWLLVTCAHARAYVGGDHGRAMIPTTTALDASRWVSLQIEPIGVYGSTTVNLMSPATSPA